MTDTGIIQGVEEVSIPVAHHAVRDVHFTAESLLVLLSSDDGRVWVVVDRFSTVYGNGLDRESALNDYVACLINQFDWLDQHRAELAGGMVEELQALESRLVRIQPA